MGNSKSKIIVEQEQGGSPEKKNDNSSTADYQFPESIPAEDHSLGQILNSGISTGTGLTTVTSFLTSPVNEFPPGRVEDGQLTNTMCKKVEEMTLQKILKHHIDGKVQLCPCSSIVSGINNEHKTKALRSFLEHVFEENDPTFQSHANTHGHCLSCHKAIISGPHPFTKLQWQQSKDAETDAVICLLSYFANLCKIRNQGSQRNYPELIEFMDNIDIDISNKEVADQIKSVYERLKEKWAQLKNDITLQEAIPIGLGLINIFDIGPGKAVQDFLPFLNHYCKKTVNVACYDSSRDTKVLMTEFNDNKCCHHYESEKYPLLKQLCGVHKEEVVALTAIDDTEGNPEQEIALIDALKKATNVEEVYHLRVSPNTMEEAKRKLEQNVLDASYFDNKPISYSLLLLNIKRTCKSFWMLRTEIKKIAEIYKFKDDGDLDDFLCFFTSFGTIFYTHDIATLRKYVIIDIIQFVEHIDDLYKSKEEATIAYGLFVKRPELDWKVVFEFLTTLGIAVEVKLIQIVQEWSKEFLNTYYFIPTARNVTLSQLDKTTGSLECSETRELQSINGYTKDNLQALLCKCLLQCKDRLLVPTDKINTTAIRFRIDDENQDIEFIDDGNRVLVRLLNDSTTTTTTTTTTRQIDKIVDLIEQSCFFFDSCGDELSRQDLIKKMKTADQKQKEVNNIDTSRMIDIAKKVFECTQEKQKQFAEKLGITKEWQPNTTKWEKILVILGDHRDKYTNSQLIEALHEIDIQCV